MPLRQDLDPRQIIKLLPGICMYDVVREKKLGSIYLNFKARLVGTDVVNCAGKDFTGSIYGETQQHSAHGLSGIEKPLSRVVREHEPLSDINFLDWPQKRHRRYSFIALPLSLAEERTQVDIVLLGVHFFSYEEEFTHSVNHLLPCQA